MIEDSKKWYHSKTLWFNVLTGVIGVSTILITEGRLSKEVASGLATFVTIGNIILRILTTKPIN